MAEKVGGAWLGRGDLDSGIPRSGRPTSMRAATAGAAGG